MSVDTIGAAQLAPYDEDEEILLMDTDGNTLQLDEPLIDTDINEVENFTEEKPNKKVVKSPMLSSIEVCGIKGGNYFESSFDFRN